MWSQVCGAAMSKAHAAAQVAMRAILDAELESIRDSGTWKSERIIVSSQGPSICVDGWQDPVLNFCANNYLGLSVSTCCLLFVNNELSFMPGVSTSACDMS